MSETLNKSNPMESESNKDSEDLAELKFNIQTWEAQLKKAQTVRNRIEMSWHTNMAFYDGKQWVSWIRNPTSDFGASLTMPKSERKRLVFNKIRPLIRNEFTKLIKEEPQFAVNPATPDQGDVKAARTAAAIAEYVLYHSKFNKARREATWWACQTGVGFIKTYVRDTDDFKSLIVFERVSPFHLFVPHLDFTDIEDQPWVIHARTYDKADVESIYGKEVEADTDAGKGTYETRFLSSLGIDSGNRFKQVHVKELWLKPNRQYPNGLFAVWANNKVLHLSDFPFEHGEYPFAKIDHIPSGGFYSTSVILDLISPQKEYNLVRSQIAESRDMTSKPAFTYTKGSLDPKDMKARPGQLIPVQPGAESPKRLTNPELPQYVVQDLERTVSDIDEISGQYEVTKGRTPPGVEAASAIAFLQEENDTRLYHTIASIEEAVSKIGRQVLSLVQQYWTAQTIIKTVSTVHLQGTIEFKGADIKGNTDLRVLPESMAPKSRTAKQATIMEYVKLSLIDPRTALKYLQDVDTNVMYNESQIDNNQAIRENLRMERGQRVVVNEWDNHVIHVMEHENFMKSEDFELLPPETQQLFIEHRQSHQMIAIGEIVTDNPDLEEEQMMMEQGAPPEEMSEEPPIQPEMPV